MDPLATLGLADSATPEEVAAAYRALAKRWHPDHAGAGAEAARRMAEINAAYDLLRDHGLPNVATATGTATFQTRSATKPARAKAAGYWLNDDERRGLGRELVAALEEHEAVALVTPTATWKSPRALLAVTDRRLLWLLDDAISHRVHSLKWRDVVRVEHRLRRPFKRSAVLRVETKLGRRIEWAELPPATAVAVERLVERGAGLSG